MAHILTFLAEGFEEVEAVTIIDLLRRAGITVTTVALENSRVTGAHDIIIHADTTMKHLPDAYDGIVLPGGGLGTDNLKASKRVLELVSTAFSGGLLCAAICAAPLVLAKAGILRGIRATCYPGCEDQMSDALYIEAAVVRDKNVITGKGVGTAIPFSLEVISYIAGRSTAERISSQIVYS